MLAVLGQRTAQAALPLLSVAAQHISTSSAAADLRDFLDSVNPEHATYGENNMSIMFRSEQPDAVAA